jgi:extradiol dioxygenase family protein
VRAGPVDDAMTRDTGTFHLSLLAADLDVQRRFYVDVVGCRLGRVGEAAMDVDFFGHQITFNRSAVTPALGYAQFHFGAIVPPAAFQALRERLCAVGVPFVVEPTEQAAGTADARWKMVVLDPSGYAIEIKSYADPSRALVQDRAYAPTVGPSARKG